MKIKRLVIENFKSIERIELVEPNPFTVFVGPNGSGKSNIFEALEFHIPDEKITKKLRLFGGRSYLQNRQRSSSDYSCMIDADNFEKHRNGSFLTLKELNGNPAMINDIHFVSNTRTSKENEDNYRLFADSFSRIFVRNDRLQKQNYIDDSQLNLSCSNLENVLSRVLENNILKNEIFEWLELFVPEFKTIDVVQNEFTGEETLLWHELYSEKPFTKKLISDGTYNILAILTAVYQSDDTPQFLCIEEPENGLHPQVAGELIDFFRIMCEERGHHIWLNTHSQSMIARLKPEEMVIVDKKQGSTRIKQIPKDDFKNWRMDEALLMNAFGGGLPW